MSRLTHIKEWNKLDDSTKLNVFRETGRQIGLPAVAVEKDWWVVQTLSIVFMLKCGKSLVFKGGTSLSKGWNLIERFSEDIDLVLDREFLGYQGELTKAEIRKLRKSSFQYISNEFTIELKEKFSDAGLDDVNINCRHFENHDQDPLIIEVYYPKLTEKDVYLKPGLLIEVGSRSLIEPYSLRTFSTFVAERYNTAQFADRPISIPTVNPERTFLEKLFLLHEELQRPREKKRLDRLSRHLYDIERIMNTQHAFAALNDKDLYNTILNHRKKFAHISGVDYEKHGHQHIRFVPPNNLLKEWEEDYKQMQENMIYGESLPFKDLIERLIELQNSINNVKNI